MTTVVRLRIVVDVDDALAAGWQEDLRKRLARGLEVWPVYGGVQVRGIPGHYLRPPVYANCWDATNALHSQAELMAQDAELAGGRSTATGAYLAARAAFLRLAAQTLYTHRHQLWLAEAA